MMRLDAQTSVTSPAPEPNRIKPALFRSDLSTAWHIAHHPSPTWVTAVALQGCFLLKTAGAQGAVPAVSPGLHAVSAGEMRRWMSCVYPAEVMPQGRGCTSPLQPIPSPASGALEAALVNPKTFGSSGPWVELDFSICLHSPAQGFLEMSWQEGPSLICLFSFPSLT